jgi:hypothetical protein
MFPESRTKVYTVGFCAKLHYVNDIDGKADFYLLHMYTVFYYSVVVTKTLRGVVQTLPAVFEPAILDIETFPSDFSVFSAHAGSFTQLFLNRQEF